MIAEQIWRRYGAQDGREHAGIERRCVGSATCRLEECVKIVPSIDVIADHDHHEGMGLETKIKVMLRASVVLSAKEGMKVCQDR